MTEMGKAKGGNKDKPFIRAIFPLTGEEPQPWSCPPGPTSSTALQMNAYTQTTGVCQDAQFLDQFGFLSGNKTEKVTLPSEYFKNKQGFFFCFFLHFAD